MNGQKSSGRRALRWFTLCCVTLLAAVGFVALSLDALGKLGLTEAILLALCAMGVGSITAAAATILGVWSLFVRAKRAEEATAADSGAAVGENPAAENSGNRTPHPNSRGIDLRRFAVTAAGCAGAVYLLFVAANSYFMRSHDIAENTLAWVVSAVAGAIGVERMAAALFQETKPMIRNVWPTRRGLKIMIATVLLAAVAAIALQVNERAKQSQADEETFRVAQTVAEGFLRQNREPVFSRLGAFRELTGAGCSQLPFSETPGALHGQRMGVFDKATVPVGIYLHPGGFDVHLINFTGNNIDLRIGPGWVSPG